MKSVEATGGRPNMTYSRFYCLFLFDGMIIMRSIGRLFGRGSMNFVGATMGRPHSAIGFSFYRLLPFSMKKRATGGRPYGENGKRLLGSFGFCGDSIDCDGYGKLLSLV